MSRAAPALPADDTAAAAAANAAQSGRRSGVVSLRTRFDFVFDIVLFLGFAVAYCFGFTGGAIHEWFGLGFGAALLVHLTLHWDWVVRTTTRMFTTTGRRRFMWIVNFLLLISMTFCIVSGILISRVAMEALGFQILDGNPFWTVLHERTAEACIGLIALHVGLDWHWIVTVMRRCLSPLRPRQARTGTAGGRRAE